jgi:hypothetical protein
VHFVSLLGINSFWRAKVAQLCFIKPLEYLNLNVVGTIVLSSSLLSVAFLC